MRVQFRIDYRTQWGETLFLILKNQRNEEQKYMMTYHSPACWFAQLVLGNEMGELCYRYAVLTNDDRLMYESDGYRVLKVADLHSETVLSDQWKGNNGNSVFSTKVFADCLFQRAESIIVDKKAKANLIIRLHCPQVQPHQHIAIVGNLPELGNWDVKQKKRLTDTDFPFWSISFHTSSSEKMTYKYLLVDTERDEVIAWESGEDRTIAQIENEYLTIVTDENLSIDLPKWKTAGVAIPVFSLRSENSFGTGDFMDLKLMVDWAKTTGQHIIQTLPINDTILYRSNADSYPYNTVSVYALHPLYLRIEEMGILDDQEKRQFFLEKKKELNKKDFSDYQNVMDEKWKYFTLIYEQEKENVLGSKSYQDFFEKNKDWLLPYAIFSHLRDKNGTPDFGKWKKHQIYHEEDWLEYTSEEIEKVNFYCFLQYHLHIQLTAVHNYALEHKVVLKSDVPIGVSPMSVDAWVSPNLFNTNMQAGAPPDDFSATGQNWGFPTYNWEEMEKDGYAWWNKRFKKFEEYFDAYRIDHILGFFRIWEIPSDTVWALTGSFYPSMPYFVQDLETKGLTWNEARYTQPYLKEYVVRAILGRYADEVMREYLLWDGIQTYYFKPDYDTQRKIEKHFSSLDYNLTDKDLQIRDGLYQLHSEVLFVKDNRNPNMYHPRISIHQTHTYADLPHEIQQLIDTIYIDYFYHRHNEFWKQQALKKLPIIKTATNMLACGEDLGMVPASVEEVLNELEILSLEIQRMPKKIHTEFAMPSDAPYLSVCTTSTHDMNPIRAWWKEDRNLTQRFYNNALSQSGVAPQECTPIIAEQIIVQHLQSSAMFVILPWQDWMAIDEKLRLPNENNERINVPSNPHNFWNYRMHLTLEQLLTENILNQTIKQHIIAAGR